MMMHPLFRFASLLLLMLLVGLSSAQAQGRLQAFTFSATAFNAESEGLQVRASLGLPFVGTFQAADTHLSTGFWRTLAGHEDDTNTPIKQAPADLPTQFILAGNYPNPFNPATTIRYALPQAEQVRLAVYDLLGREVALLVDGNMAAGEHAVVFEAAGLPSGTYLYRLEAGSFSQTRRFILLK